MVRNNSILIRVDKDFAELLRREAQRYSNELRIKEMSSAQATKRLASNPNFRKLIALELSQENRKVFGFK